MCNRYRSYKQSFRLIKLIFLIKEFTFDIFLNEYIKYKQRKLESGEYQFKVINTIITSTINIK